MKKRFHAISTDMMGSLTWHTHGDKHMATTDRFLWDEITA